MKYVVALVFCLFMGVTAISIGFGAAYPPINSIAAPIICPGGEMTYQQSVTHPAPGKTYISASWVCTDRSGKTPVGILPIALCAGTFYGLLMFVGVALMMLRGSRRARPAGAMPPEM